MSKPLPPALPHDASPWLLGCALATTLPHYFHLPYWLTLSSLLMMAWAARRWQTNRPSPGRWLLVPLVAVASAGILLEYRALFGREAGIAMLVLFMAMKLLELKSRRDGMVVITLGYFLLLTHYLNAQDIPTGLWMLFSLWLVTATQIKLHGGAASQLRPTLRHAAVLGLQSLPLMLALFVLFPRIPGPLWGLPQDAFSGKTGLSDNMTPGSVANLVRSSDIAFRVRFAGAPPAKSRLYWRGPVMEAFDGTTWHTRRARLASESIQVLSTPIAYETTLEAHNQRWLLALDAPVGIPEKASLDRRLTVEYHEPIEQRQRFHFSAALDYRFGIDEQARTRELNLLLPEGRNPRTLALARQWQQEAPDAESIIGQAIALFANPSFAYTLRPPLLGTNGIDDFLFSTRRGFCEHYAAAFVVLMRAAGLPARVVAGYQGGEFNPVDGTLVVRQSDAHAWAEVWLKDRGWVRIDPTSVVAPSRLESGILDALDAGEPLPALLRAAWLRGLRYRWDAVNNAWNQKILGYDQQRQLDLLNELGWPDADWSSLVGMLVAVASLLLGLTAAWALYRHEPGDPAQRLWHKALRHLARRQVDCAPWETPFTLQAKVDRECPPLSGPFREVVDHYLQARYGKHPDLQSLRDAVARLP